MANEFATAEKRPEERTGPYPGGLTEAEFLQEARELFQMDVDADRRNRDAAEEDLKFACDYEGAQWDETVRGARSGRPCLTNNVLPQYIGQVIGDNRINKPAIKARPAEDADEDLAEIRAGIIRAIEHSSGAQGIYAQASQAQVTCGIGHFRCGLKYADDETFLRDIAIKPIADPLSVVWDCLSVERTGRDARRCFVSDEMPRKEFERRYGKVQTGGLSDKGDIEGKGWVTRDTVRVTEYWVMVEEARELVLLNNGDTIDITDRKDNAPLDIKDRRKVKRLRPKQWLITGFSVLEETDTLPIDRIPIFRVYGQVYQVGTDRVWFGLVRNMKDQQRLSNYADSVIAETLALAPKAVWLADTVAVEGREDAIRSGHVSGDPLLVKNTGGEMTRMDPPAFPVALLTWRQTLTQSLKDVSGLHDASLGIQSNETSGKAILARQREGDVATVIYHDNLNAAIGECGRVVNQLIPVVYDTARTLRIVGEDETVKVQRVNDSDDPDSPNLSKGKFDIVIETGPSYSTKRVEAAESMMAFVQAVPTAAAVTGDLIAKAQDWPMAQEIGDRLRKTLPPGIDDKKPEDMSPEEMAAAQQAQQQAQAEQQMQMQMAVAGAQADLGLKQAQTRKAEADARKAEADASKAEAELASGVFLEGKAADIRLRQAQIEKTTTETERAEIQADDAADKATFDGMERRSILMTGQGLAAPEPAANGSAGAR